MSTRQIVPKRRPARNATSLTAPRESTSASCRRDEASPKQPPTLVGPPSGNVEAVRLKRRALGLDAAAPLEQQLPQLAERARAVGRDALNDDFFGWMIRAFATGDGRDMAVARVLEALMLAFDDPDPKVLEGLHDSARRCLRRYPRLRERGEGSLLREVTRAEVIDRLVAFAAAEINGHGPVKGSVSLDMWRLESLASRVTATLVLEVMSMFGMPDELRARDDELRWAIGGDPEQRVAAAHGMVDRALPRVAAALAQGERCGRDVEDTAERVVVAFLRETHPQIKNPLSYRAHRAKASSKRPGRRASD